MDRAKRVMREKCTDCDGLGHGAEFSLRSCEKCEGTGWQRVRCGQCWTWRGPGFFKGKKNNLTKRCHICTKKYANWEKKTLEERERATSPRSGISSDGPLRVLFVRESGNRKTGPIPVTMTAASTCPPSCPLMNRGCYAEQHMVAIHWRRLSAGGGISWQEFLKEVRALPKGQIWRHNEAGDLPGVGERLDVAKLEQLVLANKGRRGFTYTHKSLKHVAIYRTAVHLGFTINISTDTLKQADEAAALGLPVTTVLPHNAPNKGNRTPNGRHIVVCPAELRDEVTCERCKLCAVGSRKSIVGFRAHGDRKKQITERHRQLPLISHAPNGMVIAHTSGAIIGGPQEP